MKLKMLAALLLTATATPALAENWVLTSSSENGTAVILVDADAISKAPSGFMQVRLFYVMRERTNGLDAIISDALVDCAGGRIRIGRTSAYDATGKVTAVEEDAPNLPWDDIKPHTNYSGIKQAVCGEIPMPTDGMGAGVPVMQVRQKHLSGG